VRGAAFLLVALLAGCASAPSSDAPPPAGAKSIRVSDAVADNAAAHAAKMIGRPYRPGGTSPSAGFDCSGLVQYGYRQAGVALPRDTAQQRGASRPIKRAELRRGDLLFFDQEGKKNSHVGIYLGRGMFVHAPSSGKVVRTDRLEAPYWKRHLSELRRF
jgi:murein DD-endopeptidase